MRARNAILEQNHLTFRHSRESGNPFYKATKVNMDSRLRENDEIGGLSAAAAASVRAASVGIGFAKSSLSSISIVWVTGLRFWRK